MAMPTTSRKVHNSVKAPGEGGPPRFSFWLFIEAMQDADISAEELSDAMGCSQEAVARWMAGIAVPKPGYEMQAARVLGKHPEDFYE